MGFKNREWDNLNATIFLKILSNSGRRELIKSLFTLGQRFLNQVYLFAFILLGTGMAKERGAV